MKSHTAISSKVGLPPGALVHIGEHKSEKSKISIIDFLDEQFEEKICHDISELGAYLSTHTSTWINIDGVSDIKSIEEIGELFELDKMLLEDLLNTHHRPKVEEFDNCIFASFKMIGINPNANELVSEQISLVLGENWILSFQETEGDIFEPFRNRIRESKANVRKRKVDYIFYRLIDIVVDNYFFVNEFFNERIENIEIELLADSSRQIHFDIQSTKKQLLAFRRSCMPLRDVVYSIQKEKNGLIKETTFRYLNDVYEHLIHLLDSIDTQRELLSSALDLFNSGISNRMNQVMQVLTIIATIFIPLTFLAGIYGMNFESMPELSWKYGYLGVWVIMIAVFICMLFYFKKKKWL